MASRLMFGAAARGLATAAGVANTRHALLHLEHRGVVALRGTDALTFLQGLTTNDMRRLLAAPQASLFTAFLNGKGRTLFEAHVSLAAPTAAVLAKAAGGDAPTALALPAEAVVLLDVDRGISGDVLTHLKRYRLRAKVALEDLSATHAVHAVMPTEPFSLSLSSRHGVAETAALLARLRAVTAHAADATSAPSATALDPRNVRMGARAIVPRSLALDGLALGAGLTSDYHMLRMLLALPEGTEVVDTIPLEWNLPFLHGVAFDKGCYVGQELVARTHFRGLVRKRVMPVYLSAEGAPPRPLALADPVAAALVRHEGGGHISHAALHNHQQGAATLGAHAAHVANHHERRHQRQHAHELDDLGTTASGGGAGAATPTWKAMDDPHHATLSAGPGVAPAGHTATTRQHHHSPHHTPLHIPFPYLDRAWAGTVAVGDALSLAGTSSAAALERERVGKIVAWHPGCNVALASVRLEHIAHSLPPAPRLSKRDGEPVASASEGDGADAPAAVTAAAVEPRYDEADFDDPAVVAAFEEVHARVRGAGAPTVNIRVEPAAHAGASSAAHPRWRAVPVLPMFWRHIAHAGLEEVAVKTAPG